MELAKSYKREQHKKQRTMEAYKAKQCEQRRVKNNNKLPTEHKPQFSKDSELPQPIFSNIKPVSHFPMVDTGYTAVSKLEPILEKQIWTLEMLVERLKVCSFPPT